jgi:tetratricopeptide (TPR) repeat protein
MSIFSDCFFRQNDFNFALQDYSQALELDPDDENIKSRISVIYNEFGVTAYQDKNFSVSL